MGGTGLEQHIYADITEVTAGWWRWQAFILLLKVENCVKWKALPAMHFQQFLKLLVD